jgi:hypothetical protein
MQSQSGGRNNPRYRNCASAEEKVEALRILNLKNVWTSRKVVVVLYLEGASVPPFSHRHGNDVARENFFPI